MLVKRYYFNVSGYTAPIHYLLLQLGQRLGIHEGKHLENEALVVCWEVQARRGTHSNYRAQVIIAGVWTPAPRANDDKVMTNWNFSFSITLVV